ncbi:MAG: hypothetical protein Q8904_14990, partial [Bacteroidota bacterium]|nr:hypothetical protein [Bacteroidota bacterium]
GFRYFYADGLLGINPGISVPPFIFNGFGGGLYYHMKQSSGNDVSAFLASESGILYKPDKTIGIGVKSEIKFGVVKPELIDADAKFEIAFKSSGGINDINFKGFAKCLVPSLNVALPAIKLNARNFADGKSLAFDPGDSPLSVKLDMDMNFETEDFDASLEAFVRMDPIMQGVGPDGSAGRCVMHLGNSKWYIYLGTQTNPIGIKMLRMMESTSYFMAGYDIPTGMVVNPKVASILRINTSSCGADHDNARLENGKGVAFGSCMAFSTGKIQLTPFYGGFDIGAGFDILLNNYGNGAYCEGHTGTLGINGWYAKGQAYAYLDGNIGIEVKVFHRHRKFDILSIETAAQLEAEGPNPIYFEGQAGGRFRILGGMVKGNCKFKVSYGEQCKILNKVAESPLADLQLIGDVTPEADKTEVDVFTSPQAVFNVPVNQIMDISDDNNLNHKYRASLEKCELTLNGQTVPGSYQWNSDNSVLVYNPNDILADKKEYNFLVSLSFDEWQNGKWTTLTDSSGAKTVETKSVKFTTGDFPKELPQSVISYTYPLDRQYNFYPREYSKGYITFNKGMAPFFNLGPAWKQVVRFVPVSGESALTSDLSYDASSKTLSFNIPANIFCDKIYQLQLVNIPQKVSIDNNVRAQTSSTETSAGTTDVTIKTALGSVTEGEETAFYSIAFRTSKFKTFADKLSVTELKADMLYEISPYVYYLQSTFRNNEVFDKFEIYGEGTQTPLIRRTAQLEQSGWYQKNLAPLVYHTFPGNISVTWRDTSLVGCPPRGELKIWQWDYDHSLTDLEIQTGNATAINNWAQFMYGPPYYWSKDYTDIRTKLANFYPSMTNDNPQIESVLKKLIWPVIDKGNYPVKFEYVLPGINKVTTSKVINIEDPFDIAQPSL